ncbi:MAG: A/G-specific adenine glycosylase [Candidatus Saccharibacteria bacterium]
MKNGEFQELIWQKSRKLYRDMPWRQDTRPYYVLVSEVMLQQTQVDRVIPKFLAFIATFPDEAALTRASLADVLKLWQGLGYNRRAKFLHESAKMIVNEFGGQFPQTKEKLMTLPGVGANTAGAILVYSFNQPTVFIETNIRSVYIHHFFEDGEEVSDTQLRELVKQTIDQEHPREFYQALMDYGSELKRQGYGRLAQSKHHKKQSKLQGSVREVRGQIIKLLSTKDLTQIALMEKLNADERFDQAVQGLQKDGLVTKTKNYFHLTK